MTDDEDPRLDDLSSRAVRDHLRQRSKLILEAAISALLDGFTAEETVQLLREHADLLEEHG